MNSVHEQNRFDRGAVLLTLDTEQIWGYLDMLDEQAFEHEFPNAITVADKLLDLLCRYRISATWTVVGGLSLDASEGSSDSRLGNLPKSWTAKIRAGSQQSAPLWYARSFIRQLRDAEIPQEIGLHGGLTHLIWGRPPQPDDVLRHELAEGIRALETLGVKPTSFTFPRNIETRHHLLQEAGIRSYRGRGTMTSEQLAQPLLRTSARIAEELACVTPPTVWPKERLPGLWNIPSSLRLFRMKKKHRIIAPTATRVIRNKRGIRAAAQTKRVFHLWLHPDNLAESPEALDVFEEMLADIDHARNAGQVDVLTMTEVCDRMEGVDSSRRLALEKGLPA